MVKHLAITIFIVLFTSTVSGQDSDRRKAEMLIRLLPSLHDSSRIDDLNALSLIYLKMSKKDSAEFFSEKAIQEAKAINYYHGLAVAFSNKSRIAKHFDDDFIRSEAMGLESLLWFEKTPDKTGIDTLYQGLFFALFAQSKFEEAIKYSEKQYQWCSRSGNKNGMSEALNSMSVVYYQMGDYARSLDYVSKAYELALETKNEARICDELFLFGTLYRAVGDLPAALSYYRQAFLEDDPQKTNLRINGDFDIWVKMEYAELFSLNHQPDSAWYYYSIFKPSDSENVYLRVYLVSTGEYYFLQKDYDHALVNFLSGLEFHRKLNDRNEVKRTLIDIARTYLAKSDNRSAYKYATEGLNLALQTQSKQFIRDAYEILFTIYDRNGQKDSAFLYYQRYIAMKDIVANDQIKGKFAFYKYDYQINLLRKEKQLQQQILLRTAQQKNFLLIATCCLVLMGLVIFRNNKLKRKNELNKKEIIVNELKIQKLENERKLTELEMQALRTQMNPHFIFNCLNSINRFILTNNAEEASDYLTKFSKLIRIVLQNSKETRITLASELQALELYIQMEQLRFKNSFTYHISYGNLSLEEIWIPP
ncbi:MAG TPA: histidine kinase, partial [Flavisolibacter sp.]|nr:histidine kinase [Flavisolibacter sp.]